jgi:hypothetical protein
MVQQSKKEYLDAIWDRYRRVGKRAKGRILDEFTKVCSYSRKYAIALLKRPRRRLKSNPGPRPRYGADVRLVLKAIWLMTEQLCSKRLKSAIPLWLPFYEQKYGELSALVREKVLQISAASIDRMLKPVRIRYGKRGRCGTKPGTLLKQKIPVRTHNWDITKPGYLEADTVAHCGGSMEGNFVWSLTFTDIFSGWTENRACWNRGAQAVLTQIKDVENHLAFNMLGFDSDNGSEFLNWHLMKYLNQRPQAVGWTRSREYRKNDNAHVEQKNWTHVRQLLGYDRIETPEAVALINDLYASWNDLQNFFMPAIKLKTKERVGSKIKRTYQPIQTPVQRLLDCPDITEEQKTKLRLRRDSLNPLTLKKEIDRKLRKVWDAVRSSPS